MAQQSPDSPDESAQPLHARWWWSASLPLIVGVVVIGFQISAYRDGGGMWLNAVMIVVGAAVAISGLVGLKKAHAERNVSAGERSTPPGSAGGS